jgi:hypothetical protein
MSCVTADTSSAGDSDSDDSVGFSFLYFFDNILDDITDDPMAANCTTINLSSHVPVKLELRSSNYTQWKSFFESLRGKFGLHTHIDNNPTLDPVTDAWRQADSFICSWLNSSVDSFVLDFTMEPDQTAHQLWVVIEGHFAANQAPRAIFLSHSFHTMTQGDLSVEDYGKKMKKAADALRDVGMPVDAPTLLLNLLCGINSRFSTAADIIAGTAGMTFSTALGQLKLKELLLENEAKVEATNTLIVLSTLSGSTSSGSTSSGCTDSARRSTTSQKPPQQSQQ